MEDSATIENEPCPVCHAKSLTLTEAERDIPYFGKVYVFSMTCSSCKYHKADVECVDQGEPVKYEIEVNSEEDMKIRVVKSAEATVRLGRIMTMEPGTAAQGFVTNIEGLLVRAKQALGIAKADAEPGDEKKIKNMLKKLQRVMWGQEALKIVISDPSGNSAIISEKAKKLAK